jgi:glutathione peroxidase
MTARQKFLKLIYPLIILRSRFKKTNNIIYQNSNVQPVTSVYDIQFELNNGSVTTLSSYKNKKILIVNTASDCGYTKQYDGLEKLYEQHKKQLVIIGFPSNDFGEQEKGNDNEIEQFCKINYGITFPLAKKSTVIKNENQNKIFKWLSNKNENGWLSEAPSWNFCKYLINEEGVLTHYFESAIEPLSKEIAAAIQSS